MVECGFSELDITPALGLPIPGYFMPRMATGIRDALYAKALVVHDGEQVIAVISVDAIGLEREETASIRERVHEQTGIPPSHILVAATHTHTGGPVYRDRGPVGEAYASYLVDKAADAVIAAYRARRPARIGYGRGGETEISFNRRYYMKDGSLKTNPGFGNPDIVRPAGPIDPEAALLRVDAEDGTPLGVIVNFACHPDTLGGSRYSADYPGDMSRMLKRMYGDSFVSVFLNGACGNINHLDFMSGKKPDPDSARLMGRVLAGEVLKAWEKAAMAERVNVDSRSIVLMSGVRRPTEENLAQAESLLRAAEAGSADSSGTAPTDADLFFARQLVALRERNESETETEIQVVRIGSLAIAAFPCELFVEFGLETKRRSPFPYPMIAAYSNGVNGYVATPEAFGQGGYETRLTSRTRLTPNTGDRMVEAALRLMKECFDVEGGAD